MIEVLGGRKAAACITGLLIAVGAFLIKGDLPAGLADMIKYLVTTYVAGNVGADVVAAIATKKPPAEAVSEPAPAVIPPAPVSEPTDSSEQLSRIEAAIQQVGQGVSVVQNGLSHVLAQMGQRG